MRSEYKRRRVLGNIWFLLVVIFIFIFLLFVDSSGAKESLRISLKIAKTIIPILFIVIAFTTLVDYFINPQKIAKYLSNESGIKGWAIAAIGGIISHGPIFVWYQLIQDLRGKGMSSGLAAVFFYNRAIKIPLLPMMIFYFGWQFVVVLSLLMIIASFVVWKVMDFINR